MFLSFFPFCFEVKRKNESLLQLACGNEDDEAITQKKILPSFRGEKKKTIQSAFLFTFFYAIAIENGKPLSHKKSTFLCVRPCRI